MMTCHRRTRAFARALLTLLMLAAASRAHAVDGVIEINQARADKGGVTPGDAPGLPITISTGTFSTDPMSFRLTGPLSTSTSGNVIEIQSPHVTVDLNGFMITCDVPPCAGNGINSGQDNITVRNGTLRGFANGVSLTGSGTLVENVRAINNTIGLNVGSDCIVRNNIVTASGAQGIIVQAGCTVSGNTVNNNGSDGICTHDGCNVIGNTVLNNTGRGLFLSSNNGYSQNVITGNTGGTVQNGVSTGLNLCNGVITCP
jgi:parallel beta-helix repeat protein